MIYEISAAGGNITIIETDPSCEDLAARGKELLALSKAAEQAGFIKGASFTMAGGEFCGNGSRAAAMILTGFESGKAEYNVSGFLNKVYAEVEKFSDVRFNVSACFKGMCYSIAVKPACAIVRLDGITHVVLEGPAPADARSLFPSIIAGYGLDDEAAVGLIYQEEETITPLVYVKEINTVYEETACGSGSIAAYLVSGVGRVIQPTGQPISVDKKEDTFIVSSEIEVLKRYEQFSGSPAFMGY